MRKPCGVLITACTGLPAKVTLGNEKSFFPAGCQQEQQSPPCSKMQHLLSHIPRVHQETHPTHFHSSSVKQKVLQSYRYKHSLLLKMEISLPRLVIPKFSASQHFWSHFWVRIYMPELNLSRFSLLSACIKPLQISLWAEIKSESGKSWWKITFSLQRIYYFFYS